MTQENPTPEIPMTGLTGLLNRIIRSDHPESTKRTLAILAGSVLCACACALTGAIVWQAVMRDSVDGALVGATVSCHGIVAALAGVAYRKPEEKG